MCSEMGEFEMVKIEGKKNIPPWENIHTHMQWVCIQWKYAGNTFKTVIQTNF